MTGPTAFQGKAQAKSLESLANYINAHGGLRGRSIKFTFYDTQASPQNAVQFFNDAIARKAAIVVGPAGASECSAIAAIVKDGPVDYCTSPGFHPTPGSYVYSAGFSTVDLVAVMVRYLRERGLKKIALITSTDTTGQDGERSIDTALALPANNDLKIVAREHFAVADFNASAQITRIKAASPQVVIAWTTGAPFGTVLRNLNEAGMTLPVVTTLGNQTYEQMDGYTQFLPHELLMATGPFSAPERITDRPLLQAVQQMYVALDATKLHPGFPSAAPWDPALILTAAISKLGFDATATQVRDFINSQHSFVGVNGRYNFAEFPQRGLDAGTSAVMVRWDAAKGTWVAVSKLGGAPIR